jgi:HNH endonuclease
MLKAIGWHEIERRLNSPKIKRKYVWTKSGGLCWYCGAQLYCPGEADSEFKKQFVFTTDHVHPRSHGGRGRANKVPACKYCNSHKSSRSVEEFRQWLQVLACEQANRARAVGGEYGPRHWKVNSEAVVFYFELWSAVEQRPRKSVSDVRKISSEAHANRFHVRQ